MKQKHVKYSSIKYWLKKPLMYLILTQCPGLFENISAAADKSTCWLSGLSFDPQTLQGSRCGLLLLRDYTVVGELIRELLDKSFLLINYYHSHFSVSKTHTSFKYSCLSVLPAKMIKKCEITFMVCPCLAYGSLPFGVSSFHTSLSTSSKFIFQTSLRFFLLINIRLLFRYMYCFGWYILFPRDRVGDTSKDIHNRAN